MNCDEVQAQLSDYLDEALDPATIKDVEEHLASCPRCRAEAEQLAGCLRQVANLATVDPPLGFTQQVMVRVRELESKPSLWQRLLFPLSIKLPIHATAAVLISVLGIYLLRQVPPTEEARLSSERAFGILEKKKEGGRPQPKAADQTNQLRASSEEATHFQDRQRVENESTGVQPSIAARKKSNLGADEASSVGAKLLAEKARPSSAPVAPELKKRATEGELGTAVPSSPDAVSGSRTASVPSESNLRQLQATADVAVIVRRGRFSNAQRRDSLGALDKSAERESLPPQGAAKHVAPLLPAIPESAKPQEVWLTITRAQYDQLKRELLVVGSIESESWRSPREKESASRADERLRIKVTVLPPESETQPRALPPER